MVSDGGVVKVRLILDSSPFSQSWKKEAANLKSGLDSQLQSITNNYKKASQDLDNTSKSTINSTKNMARTVTNLSRSMQNSLVKTGVVFKDNGKLVDSFTSRFAAVPIQRFEQILNDTLHSTASLGNTIRSLQKDAVSINGALSSISPGDAFAGWTRSLGTLNTQMEGVLKNYNSISTAAREVGRNASGAFPIENLYSTRKELYDINKLVRDAGSSFAATGRSFKSAYSPKNDFALNNTSRNLKTLTNQLNDAKSSFVGYRSAVDGNAASMSRYNNLSKDYYSNLTKNFYEMRNGIKTTDSYSNSVKNLGNTAQYAYGRLSGMDLAVNTAKSSFGSLGSVDVPLRSATDRMVSSFGAGINTMVSFTASGVKRIGNYFNSGMGASDYVSAILGGVITGQVFNYAQQRATTKQLLMAKPMQSGSTGAEMYQQYQQYTVRSSTSDEMINRIFQFVMNSKTPSNRTGEAIATINAAGYSADPVQRNRDVLAYGAFLQGGWDQAGRMLKDEGLTQEQKDQFQGAGTFDQRLKALQDLAKSRGQMDAFGNDISTQMTGPLGNYNKVLAMSDNLMKALANAFDELLGIVAPVADWFNNLDSGTQNLIGKFVILTGGLAVGISSLKLLGSMMAPTVSGIMGLGPALLDFGAKQVVVADGAKAVSVANSAIASSGPGAIASLKGIGGAITGFLTNPVALAVIGIAALVAILGVAADKYHWFQDGVSQANVALGNMKTRVDQAKTAQSNAQKEVDKWENAVKKAKPGTQEYANATNNLKTAKQNLKKATSDATNAQNEYSEGEKTTKDLTAQLATATQKLAEDTIKYRVAVGELTPEQGKVLAQGAQGAADELTPAQQKIKDQRDVANRMDTTITQSTPSAPIDKPQYGTSAHGSQKIISGESLSPWQVLNWNPLSTISPNLFGNWGLPNLNFGGSTTFEGLKQTISGWANSPLQMLGGLFSPVSAGTPTGQPGATKPTGATSVQSATNPNAMQWPTAQDILNGLGLGNFHLPTFTWPSLQDIENGLGLGNFHLPTIRVPTLQDIEKTISDHIPRINWRIPGLQDIIRTVSSHIPSFTWHIPSAGIILNSITGIIPPFHWPWGPASAVSSVGSGISGGGSKPFGPPRGPLTSSVTSVMAKKSGVGSGYINQSMNAGFNGVNGFKPIANYLSDNLSYEFYMGDQKSDSEVWNSKSCNCYDGMQLLIDEASNRFKLGTAQRSGVWDGTDIPHAWSIIGGVPFDMAAKLLRGYWHPPSGPQQNVAQFLQDLGPGLEYVGYGGHRYDPVSSLMSGGNCFDMSLGLLQTVNDMYGVKGNLVWGNWEGQSHVWTRFGSTDYDPARRALTGSWNPPPQGPLNVHKNWTAENKIEDTSSSSSQSSGNGGDTYIITVPIQGDVWGMDDAESKIGTVAEKVFKEKDKKRAKKWARKY